jgi:hypothetical protein
MAIACIVLSIISPAMSFFKDSHHFEINDPVMIDFGNSMRSLGNEKGKLLAQILVI